jgi:hypothetical protein
MRVYANFSFHPMGVRKKLKNRLNYQPILLDIGHNYRNKRSEKRSKLWLAKLILMPRI